MDLNRNKVMDVERFEEALLEKMVHAAKRQRHHGEISDLALNISPFSLQGGGRMVGIDIVLSGKVEGGMATMHASFNFRDGPFWAMRSENLSSEMVMVRVPKDAERGVRNVSFTEFQHPAVVDAGREDRGEALARIFDRSCGALVSQEMNANDPFSNATPDPNPIFRDKGITERVSDFLTPSF
jgi:hypothetical protein